MSGLYQSLPETWEDAKPILEKILQQNASVTGKAVGLRRRRPDPPRDLQTVIGTLDVTVSWTAPVNPVDIAGWRIYKDTELNLIDKISDPSTLQAKIKLSVTSPTAFYVSSVNAVGQESIKMQVIATPAAVNLGSVTGNLDNISDGTTYGRPVLTRLSAGKPLIDFAESIHLNKIIDNVGDGHNFGRMPLGNYGNDGPVGKLPGFQFVSNPDFQNGLTNYLVYDNNDTGNVTLTLVADSAAPTGFGQKMKVATVAGAAPSPGLGGFRYVCTTDSGSVAADTYHVGDTYIIDLLANIPTGYTLNFTNNSLGTGGTFTWLSSQAGTGNWQHYILKVIIGPAPSGLAFPFFYLTGTAPVTWYVGQLNITDVDQPARFGVLAIDPNHRPVIDFGRAEHVNKILDNIPDGTTYAKTVASDQTGNRVDFSKGLLNKQLDNIPDGSTYGRPVLTRLSAGKPLIDFSESIHLNKNLDNVADGTRVAWDSGTMKTAAVDTSGNLKLKNINDAVGATISPNTTSTTYAVIPEMTQTLTFKGNKVLLVFTASLNLQTQTATNQLVQVAIFKDGVQLSQDYEFTCGFTNGTPILPVTNWELPFAVSFIDQPSAGSHTYDIRWRLTNTGPTLFNLGTRRRFQIVELG